MRYIVQNIEKTGNKRVIRTVYRQKVKYNILPEKGKFVIPLLFSLCKQRDENPTRHICTNTVFRECLNLTDARVPFSLRKKHPKAHNRPPDALNFSPFHGSSPFF